jgi:hypothetical protein
MGMVEQEGFYTMHTGYIRANKSTLLKKVQRIATTSGLTINNKLACLGDRYKSYPTTKAVNGKPIGNNCVTCGTKLELSVWLCMPCVEVIGHQNINDVVNNMPEYLADDQYEKWLKLKLNKFRYETN